MKRRYKRATPKRVGMAGVEPGMRHIVTRKPGNHAATNGVRR